MSAQSLVYLYNQRQLVVLLEHSSSPRRYEKVYSKELTINKGVDNVLEFSFVNQEQKPIDITNKDIVCKVINYDGTKIVLQKSLTHIYPLTGLASLQLTKNELDDIEAQRCFYTLEIPVNQFVRPLYVDEKGGARGILNIVHGLLPEPVESEMLLIPSHMAPSLDKQVEYVTSYISTSPKNVSTFQCSVQEFTGDLIFEGSILADFSHKYEILSIPHDNATGAYGINVIGYHPYVRLRVVNKGTVIYAQSPDYPDPIPTMITGDLISVLVR